MRRRAARLPLRPAATRRACAPVAAAERSRIVRTRLGEPGVGDVHGARHELVAAFVGHADHRRVDAEHVDDRLRDGAERRVERQALREGPRDLVQRPYLPRRLAFRLEHGAERLTELLRAFVQARVLHGDGELGGERGKQA